MNIIFFSSFVCSFIWTLSSLIYAHCVTTITVLTVNNWLAYFYQNHMTDWKWQALSIIFIPIAIFSTLWIGFGFIIGFVVIPLLWHIIRILVMA